MATTAAGRLKPHESIAWSAIAKHGDGESERSTLIDGVHAVDLTVTGTVNGEPFTGRIAGRLSVAANGERQEIESAPVEQVVAWLLAELAEDDEARAAVLRRLPKVWQTELPDQPASEIQQAKQLLKRLRRRLEMVPKNGAVSFTPTATT
jgi:hypothetical protein